MFSSPIVFLLEGLLSDAVRNALCKECNFNTERIIARKGDDESERSCSVGTQILPSPMPFPFAMSSPSRSLHLLPVSLYLTPCHSALCPSLRIPCSPSHALCRTYTLFTLFPSRTHPFSLSLTHTHTYARTHTLTYARTHTKIYTYAHAHAHTYIHKHSYVRKCGHVCIMLAYVVRT